MPGALPLEPHASGSAGHVDVAVSLNGAQYTSRSETGSSRPWWPPSVGRVQLYAPPLVTSISPSSGPARGGTAIAVIVRGARSALKHTVHFLSVHC